MEWTPDKLARLVALRERELSFAEIAEELTQFFGETFTKDSVQKKAASLFRVERLTTRPPTDPMPHFHQYFTEDGQPRQAALKHDLETYLAELAAKPRKVEILFLSDWHIPFHDERLVDQILAEHAAADLVVVGGDYQDVHAYSRFLKERHVPIEREIEESTRLRSFLAERFPLIVEIGSNHLARVAEALKVVPAGLQFLVEPDLARRLAAPFPNWLVLPEWYVQIGDAVFAHADYSRGAAPKAAVQVAQWLGAYGRAGQVPIKPFRVVVQGHTHHVGTLFTDGVKCIESGCLAKLPLAYTIDARAAAFKEPQTNGYAVVIQRGGQSLVNECREVYLGTGSGSGWGRAAA